MCISHYTEAWKPRKGRGFEHHDTHGTHPHPPSLPSYRCLGEGGSKAYLSEGQTCRAFTGLAAIDLTHETGQLERDF